METERKLVQVSRCQFSLYKFDSAGSILKHLAALFLKYKLILLAALKPFGYWSDRPRAWLYVLMAAIGSAIGGLLPFFLGRAGGELFLLKRVDRARYENLRDRFARQEFLALLIPSMLPPPTPWKMFVFGAGVFEMKTLNFMAAVLAGRIIRFSVLAFVTVRYGPEMAHVIGDVARRHLAILIGAVGMILVVLLVAGVRAMMSKRPVPDQGV